MTIKIPKICYSKNSRFQLDSTMSTLIVFQKREI